MNSTPYPETPDNGARSRGRVLIVIAEIGMILVLLGIWLFSKSVKTSTNLIVLFFYSFPSEFLVGLVPHEPVLLYFGQFYSPLTVAIVSVISTVMAEGLNYSVFGFFADTELFRKFTAKKSVRLLIDLFNKSPFWAVWVAGFTPIPFYPFRFLVVMGKYPVRKYLLAVFLSRGPRFYILAGVGYLFNIPGVYLLILFVVLIIFFNASIFSGILKKEQSGK